MKGSLEHRVRTLDRMIEAETAVSNSPEAYAHHCELADTLAARAERMEKHKDVRHRIAKVFRDRVYPDIGDDWYLELARQLEYARPSGIYGEDLDGSLADQSWNRAGLPKLCPDDARWQGKRTESRFATPIRLFHSWGYQVRAATFTWPNVPQWHLAASMHGIFQAFKTQIIYGRRDGKLARNLNDPMRRFPEIRGAIAVLEAPLSRLADEDPSKAWNVHLHVILICRGRPDYGRIRATWRALVHFDEVSGSAQDVHDALAELVKYPMRAISDKSSDDKHRASGAPAFEDWPSDYIDEWMRAHRGFKRSRTWGELHKVSGDVGPRDLEHVDWLGHWRFVGRRFVVSYPLPPAAGPPGDPRVTLIQGTFYATGAVGTLNGGSARGAGPPEYAPKWVRDRISWRHRYQ